MADPNCTDRNDLTIKITAQDFFWSLILSQNQNLKIADTLWRTKIVKQKK